MSNSDLFGEVISCYSRAQAIEDGCLVDVSEQASPAQMMGGFTIPVAVTRALWTVIADLIPDSGGDMRGRLNDVLTMASYAARVAKGEPQVDYEVTIPAKGTRKRNRFLRMVVGGGDDGLPVITIGFPEDF